MSIRWDSAGLHWQDAPPEPRRGGERVRPIPPIPETGWLPPREFPRLDAADILAIDTETKDPNIKTLGPGDCRGDGEIVGVSLATIDQAWYFPVRHTLGAEMNLDPEKVFAWLRDILPHNRALKVGHRLAYDLGWLATEGVEVAGPFYDTSIAAALLDENRFSYSLDALAQEALGIGKEDEALYEWCYTAYGGKPGRPQIANIWRAPPQLAGPYAEQDARLPLQLMMAQAPQIEQEGLSTIVDIEMRLMPMLHAMRRRGVRVDSAAAERLDATLSKRADTARGIFKQVSGRDFIDSNVELAKAFDRAGLAYPKTAKGNPSFTKEWLQQQSSPLAQAIVDTRKWEKTRGTFVERYLLTHAVDGRIHAEINQVKYSGDSQGERGTIGRFSYTNPNLQNIPSRDPDMKRAVRGLFLPEDGEDWESDDYSQIEFRMLAHMGLGSGIKEVIANYRRDPKTDYHDMAQEMIQYVVGIALDRKPTKNMNFGLVFGMGKEKIVRSLGVAPDMAENLYAAYHEALPFAKTTYDAAMNTAQNRGYIKTLLGRRRRYTMWESSNWKTSRKDGPMSREAAIEQYGEGRIRRAFTNSALNNVLQLSAADVIKKAMVDIWAAGICDVVGAPLIQVHDELNFSVPRTPMAKAAMEEARALMTGAWPALKVPLMVDSKTGPSWGEL